MTSISSPAPIMPSAASTTPTLAVIVPATDAPATLECCFDAIERSAAAPAEVLVIQGDIGQPGPAAARNAGAARTSADVLVFVDSDVEIAPDALGRIASAFAERPDLDAVFGAYDDDPAAPGTVSRFRNLLHHHVHTRSAGPATTFWAGIGAVRAEAFHAVGGFDADRYPGASIEDVEFGARLVASGCTAVLEPRIRGCHLKQWSLLGMVRSDLFDRGAPWTRLLVERRVSASALSLGWRHRLSALCSMAAVSLAVRGRFKGSLVVILALTTLNLPFYRLLGRRLGVRGVVLGVPLHMVHHLTAMASVGVGVFQHLRDRRPR